MLTAVQKIRGAVATKDIIPDLTYYFISNGFIHASNGHITAAAPCPDDREYIVPASMFEKFLKAAEQPKITVTEDGVKITSKSFRGNIQKIEKISVSYHRPEGKRVEVDASFVAGLRKIRPFVSENATQPWAAAVHVNDNKLYATNNVVLARVDIGATNFHGALPVLAIDFILNRQEKLVALSGIDDQNISFFWEDGSWVRTQLVIGEFPQKGLDLLMAAEEPTFPVTTDWLMAFNKVAQFCEGVICLAPDKIYDKRSEYQVETDALTPVPEGAAESRWNPKFLSDVLAVATHWQPQAWPKPAPFKGSNINGVIVGRN